jgi:hypothetical protein
MSLEPAGLLADTLWPSGTEPPHKHGNRECATSRRGQRQRYGQQSEFKGIPSQKPLRPDHLRKRAGS